MVTSRLHSQIPNLNIPVLEPILKTVLQLIVADMISDHTVFL